MKPKKPLRIRKKIAVPIYDATVWILVVENVAAERKKWNHLFGENPDTADYDALACYSGRSQFAIFFEWKPLTLKIVAHEVFHVTHRIMDWAGANFDASHHEQGALLHGFLMDAVLKAVRLTSKLHAPS